MTNKTILADTLADMTRQALRYHRDGRMARDEGYETEAGECFLDAADALQAAGEFAGTHGLEMPALLDGEHALVDLFQWSAIKAYEASHHGRTH